MALWNKLVTSGSNAELRSLYVQTAVTASIVSASQFIGTITSASYAVSASYAPSSPSVSASYALEANNLYFTSASLVETSSFGTKTTFNSGDLHNFGDAVYIDSNGNTKIGNASSINTSYCIALAIQNVIATGSTQYLLNGIIKKTSWTFTPGQPLFLSASGATGNITQTQPTGTGKIIQILGIAVTANTLYFNPQLVQVELA